MERQQEAIFSVFIDLFCNDVIAFEIGGLQIRTTEKSSSFLEEYGIVDLAIFAIDNLFFYYFLQKAN